MKSYQSLIVLALSCLVLHWLAGCAATSKSGEASTTQEGRADADLKTNVGAGKAAYDTRCASCHRVGSYDSEGDADDLAGRKRLTAKFVLRHTGASITDEDLASLRAFLVSQ